MATNLPPTFLEQRKKELTSNALGEMVRMQLLNEKVKAAGITVSDDEITEEMKSNAAMQKVTLEEFQQRIKQYGYDMEQIKSQIRTILGHRKLMAKEFPEEAKYTEEDAQAYYEKNKARYETPEQIRASHILLKVAPSDPNSDPNEVKAAAMAKAEDLLKQIKEGADFAALAKTHSQGPSAPRGGDLDFFGRGSMVPPFDKAAFELKEIGDVSGIVETQYGLHIIKLTGKKEASTTSFEEAKDQIMAQQGQMKLRELAMNYAEKLRAEAEIVPAPGVELKSTAPQRPPGGAVAPK
jgi:peptidyl-prolyl cis-trans isomerase C